MVAHPSLCPSMHAQGLFREAQAEAPPMPVCCDAPPMGCDADAIKLFLGNIPKGFTEGQLLAFFETVGHVVELVIVRDKRTHRSKGSAFLWYASRAAAQQAILHFDQRFTLPDASGKLQALVVRQALPRAAPAAAAATATARSSNCSSNCSVQQLPAMCYPTQAAEYLRPARDCWEPRLSRSASLNCNMEQRSSISPALRKAAGLLRPGALRGPEQYRAGGVQQQYGGLLRKAASLPCRSGVPQAEQYNPPMCIRTQSCPMYGNAPEPARQQCLGAQQQFTFQDDCIVDAPAPRSPPVAAAAGPGDFVQTMVIDYQQLLAVEQHLYGVQLVSGACLNVMAHAPGLFRLSAAGSEAQALAACILLDAISAGISV